MPAKTISLRDLRARVKALDKLVTDAWFNTGVPAEIDFAEVREHAAAISALIFDDSASPQAATATKSPAAATDTDKSNAKKRAAYQRAAADKRFVDLSAVLGLGHIRRI
jgi:topoisomerase IA-like protein